MNILAIDTASNSCSVLLSTSAGDYFQIEESARSHSRHVLMMLETVLAQAAFDGGKLDKIVWNAGPGSFTGLRIGASVVQALAYSFDVPVQPLSSLEVMAFAAVKQYQSHQEDIHSIVVAQDAKMNGVYWARFACDALGRFERLEPDALRQQETVTASDIQRDGVLCVGDGWKGQSESVSITAKDVMALARFRGDQGLIDDPAQCLPFYVHSGELWQKRVSRSHSPR